MGVCSGQDLADLPIEALGQVPVVETAKEPSRLFEIPASAYIFDAEAIEYLPVDSIPEMLRYAPGVHVQRASAGMWGMGIRGMNSRFLSRTLFTVDEQNIYSTLYAGLFGSQHDLLLDDVASVEVVYGPGGSLWGMNAVNGMVNVVMKSAFETEGGVARLQYGSHQRAVSFRQGWAVSDRTSARVFAKYTEREDSESPLFEDDWKTARIGFQLDSRLSGQNLITFSGEAYTSELGQGRFIGDLRTGAITIDPKEEEQRGVNAQAKWTHQKDSDNGFSLRSFVGYTEYESSFVNFELGIAGAELRGRRAFSDRHRLVYNASVTAGKENLEDTGSTQFFAGQEDTSLTAQGGFEYTWVLIPDHLEWTAGLNGVYSSTIETFDLLPSTRLLWKVSEDARLWFSFGQAVRSVPSGMNDIERILFNVSHIPPVTFPTPVGSFTVDRQFTYGGRGPEIENERLDAFEIGYRQKLGERVSFRVQLFHYRYEGIYSSYSVDSQPQPVLTVPEPYFLSNLYVTNITNGYSTGMEFEVEAQLHERLSVRFNYAWLEDHFEPAIESANPFVQQSINRSTAIVDNNVPRHLASVWLTGHLSDTWRADVGLRYSSEFRNSFSRQPEVFQLDARLSWQFLDCFRLSLLGRNLLDEKTDERVLKDLITIPVEVPREWSLELRYSF
jgi:iron complex outermembrane receptor protein